MAKITDWETKKENIVAKNIAIYNILTGEPIIMGVKNVKVLGYSVYLLQQMGLVLGGYGYYCDFENRRGISSTQLEHDVFNFNNPDLIEEAVDYIIHKSTNGTAPKVGELLLESKSSMGSGYDVGQYLGAMANAHYIGKAYSDRKNFPGKEVLDILRHDTPFRDKQGNARALHSVRSLMRR